MENFHIRSLGNANLEINGEFYLPVRLESRVQSFLSRRDPGQIIFIRQELKDLPELVETGEVGVLRKMIAAAKDYPGALVASRVGRYFSIIDGPEREPFSWEGSQAEAAEKFFRSLAGGLAMRRARLELRNAWQQAREEASTNPEEEWGMGEGPEVIVLPRVEVREVA